MSDQSQPDRPDLTPDLNAFLGQLESFAPAPLQIDRDRLMFEAGRAAERATSGEQGVWRPSATGLPGALIHRSTRFWRVATSVMTAASIMLAMLLVGQQRSRPVAQFGSPSPSHQTAAPAAETIVEGVVSAPEHFAEQLFIPRATKGYLGVRYVALTRGVGAITGSGQNDRFTAGSDAPATARELLEELLPGATRQRS